MFKQDSDGTATWSEILEPVHHAVASLIDLEANGKGMQEPYTDSDVIAVSLLYSLVLGNRLYYILDDQKASLTMAKSLSEHFSSVVQETTFAMSGINMKTYYKERGKDKK